MYYRKFDTSITNRYGIIIVNWPLPMFQLPRKFNSAISLRVLYDAWKTGTTYFKKLTPDEYQDLLAQRRNRQLQNSREATISSVPAPSRSTSPASSTSTPDNVSAVSSEFPTESAPSESGSVAGTKRMFQGVFALNGEAVEGEN